MVAACTKKPLALFSTKSSIISLGLVCQDVFGTYDVVDEVEMVCKIIHCPNGGEASEKCINLWLAGSVGLWCLTPLLTIFQFLRGCQFF